MAETHQAVIVKHLCPSCNCVSEIAPYFDKTGERDYIKQKSQAEKQMNDNPTSAATYRIFLDILSKTTSITCPVCGHMQTYRDLLRNVR